MAKKEPEKQENECAAAEKQEQGSECAAAEKQEQDNEYAAVEELKEVNKIPDAVHQGICAANGWQKGRMVTKGEYEEARSRFLGAAIGGGRK